MPTIHELNVKPAREAIHEQFIYQITRASGLAEFRDTLADYTVVPTPGAVLLATGFLAGGTHEQEGVGSLILLDIGGATTDIHSALPLHKKYCFYSPDGLECFNYEGSSLGFCSMRASSTQPLLSLGGFEGAIQIVDTERLLLLRELCVFSDMGGRNTVGGTVMIDM